MPMIRVGKYARSTPEQPSAAGDRWRGWLESRVGEWVMFVIADGSSVTFLSRDPDTGAVLSEDPGS